MRLIAGPLLATLLSLAAVAAERPNVVFVFTDQQSAGMLGCAGNRYVKTPAMDSLAREGARFERACCANPVCVPSRFSMMTGVMPSRIGMEDNNGVSLRVPGEVLAHAMGRVFREAGYTTAYGGKVHTPMSVQEMGFEMLTRDSRMGLVEACVQFLGRKHERPFLLVASLINPHDICYMAIRDAARATGAKPAAMKKADRELATLTEALRLPEGVSREEFFARVCPPLPANFEVPRGEPSDLLPAAANFRSYVREHWTAEQWRLHRWAYARLTERVDAEIGKVLTALRAAGLERKTLVVFSSDHGDMDAAHRLEHKSVLYEEAVRVPLVVSFKGVTRPGLVDREHLVSTGLDLLPTLCDFAGIPSPAGLAGRSVRKLAEGQAADGWRDCLVVEGRNCRLLRTVGYKYIVYGSGSPREQLIDLVEDPGEMKNLAMEASRAPVLAEHRQLLRRWYQDSGERLDPKYILPTP